MAATRTGRFAILEQLLADGIGYMFGNPGTVEQGFLDALGSYPDLQYILTLQETIAVAIGDGYARATARAGGRPAPQRRRPRQRDRDDVPGQARRDAARRDRRRVGRPLRRDGRPDGGRPRVDGPAGDEVGDAGRRSGLGPARPAAGDQDRRHAADRARSSSCLPADVLDAPERASRSCRRRSPPRASSRTPGSSPRRPRLLAGAERPIIIMGDGIAMSGAQAELTRVAELLGADVWGANSSEVNIDDAHPLFRGNLGPHVRPPQPAARRPRPTPS